MRRRRRKTGQKCAIPDVLQSPHSAVNRVQITCNPPSAYHAQPAVCHVVRRDSSAIKLDRVKIAFT